ncbi:Sugar transport protein 13 [Capsicum baccatum]|uniref:Sugar transport protein 13 n=1 Tax=Capsicum baccatum TaxID=33114 RepID=A0A2G2WHX4_CAPBA|nr:Sugar transport protein 13 [Capsicum baccatum]
MKVDSMGNEIEKLKTNEVKLKSKATNQLTPRCAELCRSEDIKIPDLKGDVGTLHKTHNIYQSTIAGGVTSMDDFLEKFCPKAYVRKHKAKENNYCKYDNQMLQLFTSSLYLTAIVCCLFDSKCCKRFGRKLTMQLGSLFFFIGVVLNAAAIDLPMLIIGRLFLGAGV